MTEAWAINADGGSPEYTARELRRIAAIHLHPGSADRFGAREGVRPHSTDVVTMSGTTWTVADCSAVVYPGLTSISGPYIVELEQTSGSLDPADGTNDRVDAIDLQVRDDDEDASGARDVRVVYVPGTPASSPSAPSLTSNALRLATILVPAGGSPSPSVSTLAQWTVASGGVLPVRDDTEGPSSGLYHGAVRYRQDTDTLEVWDGSAWTGLASVSNHDYVEDFRSTGWTSYTPTISGGGSATFSTHRGWWRRIAPKTVFFTAYFTVDSDGSGTSNVQIDAPTDIDRFTRQVATVSVGSLGHGSGAERDGHLVSFTGGSGATWDRLRVPLTTSSDLDNITGEDLISGQIWTCQGIYREA